MPNGYRQGGRGFGFRGSSPPWPYIGRGRGGLPRCGYIFRGAESGASPYAGDMTREQELDLLKVRAEAMKEELEQIDDRIKELEAE